MNTPQRLALVTGARMAKPDPESHLLVDALAALGVEAVMLPWDSDTDWASFPLVVVRTPWDYFERLDEFLDWARRVDALTQLTNPYVVIAWNSHKRYLQQLTEAGLATVPTVWLGKNSRDFQARLNKKASLHGWDEVVVKPAVSIGAIGALRTHVSATECSSHISALLQDGDVLVQPFLPSIASAGEVSLIFFGGEFSHAIRKVPQAGDYRVQDMYGGSVHPHTASPEEIAVARAVLEVTPAPTSYARIDLVHHNDRPVVMEAELIEPELFLGATPEAPQRLAKTLLALLPA